MSAALPFVSVVGGLIESHQASKAQKRAAAQQMELAKPSLEAQKWAFPMMQNWIATQVLPQATEPSAALAGQRTVNLSAVRRKFGGLRAQSRRFWTGTGNLGRGRGEQMRLGQAETEASNLENLRYTTAEEARRTNAIASGTSALATMAGLGVQGLQPAMQAIQTGADAAVQQASDMAGMFGMLSGIIEGKAQWKREQEFWRTYKSEKN